MRMGEQNIGHIFYRQTDLRKPSLEALCREPDIDHQIFIVKLHNRAIALRAARQCRESQGHPFKIPQSPI